MINIEHEFEYAGGVVTVHLTDRNAKVIFEKQQPTKPVWITDADGDIADWHRLYGHEWAGLSGSALKSKETAFAKQYAINAIGDWIICTAEEVESLRG